MIFATVGTHEDPFDRLVEALDRLETDEEILIQSGYSTYRPHLAPRCAAEPMMGFAAIQAAMHRARVIVTHGGPASIMQALTHGKVPIVVPRQSAFREHVDDHQVRFARRIGARVIVVLDIADLAGAIRDYDARVRGLGGGDFGPERARVFARRLDDLCRTLVSDDPGAGASVVPSPK
jgi:UDP-N-acetylglucosamine transferase subunit ALG13